MLSSWFGSTSSRRSQPRQTRSYPPPAVDDAQSGPSDASSVSQSTVGPLQTPANLTSASDVPGLEEVHAYINDPSIYPPTPSLIHSAEKEAGTSDARTSLDATTHQGDTDSAPVPKRVSASERPEGTLFTPQDAIIAQVFGKPVPSATHPDSARSATSPPPPPSNVRPGPKLTIYDPFPGVKLGEHTPRSPSTATPGESSSATPLPAGDDRKLWSSLERILELQAEISAMHTDMEGVGGRTLGNTHAGGMTGVGAGEGGNVGSRRKRSRRGQTLPVGDEEPETPEPEGGTTGFAVSEISTDRSDGEGDGDEDEDEDEDDIHGYGKKRRDEEFARLAEQFAQRKVAISGIMNKLDDLSMALKTFHTLPPPLFEFSMFPSRADTMSSSPSSPPSPQVHPGRPSSPFSSISPSQATHSATPPVMLSPPVPPVSILAPRVSLNDPSAPPAVGPVVAPVLPRTASPRILPGTPHVESPADMHPAQSVSQRAL